MFRMLRPFEPHAYAAVRIVIGFLFMFSWAPKVGVAWRHCRGVRNAQMGGWCHRGHRRPAHHVRFFYRTDGIHLQR